MASHRIHTRSHPDPNPPPVVENPERILWQTPKFGKSATDRNIPREKYVSEHHSVLEDSHFDLHHTKNIFRTRSQNDLNQADLQFADLHQSFSREASPSTPPDS